MAASFLFKEVKKVKYANICNMDTQGRIVIPAKIRKLLNINDGEPLEVELVNQEIRLRKCSNPVYVNRQLQTFLTILYNNIRHSVFVCSTTQVFAAKGAFIPEGTAVPDELAQFINDGTEIMLDLASPIYLLPYLKEPIAALFPINQENELALIVLSRTPLTEMESGCARLIATTLGHVLH